MGEIALIAVLFPLWFPLLIVASSLLLVFYFVTWSLAIVAYSVELSFVATSITGLAGFIAYLIDGSFQLTSLGFFFAGAGAASLFVFACVASTKATVKFSKGVTTSVKNAVTRKGN